MPAAQRPSFPVLALVAMLLLALLPTVGRLAGGMPMACEDMPAPSTQASSSMSEMMAHMTPAEHRAHMAMMARMAKRSAPSAPQRHDGHDCPYCPLLSGLASMAAPVWSPHAPVALAPWSVRAVAQRPVDAPVPALGAQGPPVRVVA